MPIYEYNCPKCGRFEAIQNFSDKPLKCKPDCSEKKCPMKAERLISAAAFHLKGTGWYKTDYASGSSSSGSSSSSTPKSTGDSDSSSKTKKKEDGGGSSSKDSKDAKDTKKGGCGPGCGCH